MQVPRRKAEERRRFGSVAEDRHLTPEAVARLKDELARLQAARPAVAEEVARTKEMGDLSENAGYQEAKGRLRGINGRILELQDRIKHAVVIVRPAAPDGRVGLGSTVRLRVGPAERTYRIVGSQEADPSRGLVSQSSPLGAALLGHAAGDTVTLSPNGTQIVYGIIEVT